MTDIKEIEKSLIKKYRKEIWSPFIKAIKEFKLIEEGDRVGVAISGGKDSLLLAKLIEELHKHGPVDFDVEYLSMNPGYDEENLELLKKNLAHLQIPGKIYDSRVFDISETLADGGNPCYLCARMRRGFLYAKAKELGCNKLALGHHLNDVIETIMINVLYAGNYKTMKPKLTAQNFDDMLPHKTPLLSERRRHNKVERLRRAKGARLCLHSHQIKRIPHQKKSQRPHSRPKKRQPKC